MYTLPNSLTTLRILLTPVFLILLLSDSPMSKQLSLIVYVLAALTDWYDGWIARKFGTITEWGKFLDPLADKILAASALFAFAHLDLIDAWMVWVIVSRDAVVTALRIAAERSGSPLVTSKTAQAKTFGEFLVIYYILILYVASHVPALQADFGKMIDALMQNEVLFGMMLLVTLSSIGTGIVYLFDNRKVIRNLYDHII